MRPTVLFLLACTAVPGQQFLEHTVAAGLTGGYQIVVVDMNKDGKPDLIALASGLKELVWFENPNWTRHVIAGGFNRMINVAAADLDGDGIPELVLASEFNQQSKNSAGLVQVLEHREDPNEPWKATEIDRLTTSHRLRWANVDGKGKVVVNAPLVGADGPHTPVVFYRPGDWVRESISEANEGIQHGIFVVDWDGDGRDEILTASNSGIHLHKLEKDGKWSRTELSKEPSSDVAVGKAAGQRFLAAIEPWHGNRVAVYRQVKGQWQRTVIDESLVDGHTIQVGDFNGDGNDEIVAGFRGTGRSVFLYSPNKNATKWTKSILDQGGMAAAACAVADLNGDGKPDIACIGSATANLKWYENRATR